MSTSQERLNYSRCGSKQSLLDTASHKSSNRLSIIGAGGPGGSQGGYGAESGKQKRSNFFIISYFSMNNLGASGPRSPDPSTNHHQHHYVTMPPVMASQPPGRPPHGQIPHPDHNMDRRQRNARRKDIQKKLDQWDRNTHDR